MSRGTNLSDPRIETELDQDSADDKDLIQLAGYHAYQMYEDPTTIKVNGKEFEVIDTEYGTETGLDALTVRNVENGELIVVFVGSDQIKGDWIETNANLIGEAEPAQLLKAKGYIENRGVFR